MTGKRAVPETPDALRGQLLATANFSTEERRKIFIDVSNPERQAGALAS